MKEFIAVGFRGHPEFVKEMSLFMLTQRVDPSQLVCLEDKVNTNARDYHQIKKEYKALEEKFNTLKRNHDNLSNEVHTLAKKVNKG
jgi:chromosome segregation ATPase